MSSAALVAIGTIAAVAKIAFDEKSWVALIVLLVTMVQVRDIRIVIQNDNLLLSAVEEPVHGLGLLIR